MSQRQIEHRHGSLLALSHALHRKIIHLRKTGKLTETLTSEWIEPKTVLYMLIEHLNDQQPLLVSAAISGISLIGSVIKLPLPERQNDGSSNETVENYEFKEKMDVDGESKDFTKAHVAQTILRLLKSAHSRQKIREEAALCLGHLAIGDGAFFTHANLNEFIKLIKLVCSSCK